MASQLLVKISSSSLPVAKLAKGLTSTDNGSHGQTNVINTAHLQTKMIRKNWI